MNERGWRDAVAGLGQMHDKRREHSQNPALTIPSGPHLHTADRSGRSHSASGRSASGTPERSASNVHRMPREQHALERHVERMAGIDAELALAREHDADADAVLPEGPKEGATALERAEHARAAAQAKRSTEEKNEKARFCTFQASGKDNARTATAQPGQKPNRIFKPAAERPQDRQLAEVAKRLQEVVARDAEEQPQPDETAQDLPESSQPKAAPAIEVVEEKPLEHLEENCTQEKEEAAKEVPDDDDIKAEPTTGLMEPEGEPTDVQEQAVQVQEVAKQEEEISDEPLKTPPVLPDAAGPLGDASSQQEEAEKSEPLSPLSLKESTDDVQQRPTSDRQEQAPRMAMEHQDQQENSGQVQKPLPKSGMRQPSLKKTPSRTALGLTTDVVNWGATTTSKAGRPATPQRGGRTVGNSGKSAGPTGVAGAATRSTPSQSGAPAASSGSAPLATVAPRATTPQRKSPLNSSKVVATKPAAIAARPTTPQRRVGAANGTTSTNGNTFGGKSSRPCMR